MASRTTPLLLKALLDVTETHSARLTARGNGARGNLRRFGSCGVLATRRSSLQLCPASAASPPSRTFINLTAPIAARRMEYNESRTMGFSPEQMYALVASVDRYQEFVPWCKKSRVRTGKNGGVLAELEIGFPPVTETYTSELSFIPNHQVRALCSDGSLFSHLETIWRFSPGAKGQTDSCKVDFYVSFEFKSLLHSQLAGLFFDEVVKQMVGAFEKRAATLYRSQQEAPLRRRSA
ncbi:coenzyme Q-binding protein COQ10 homolog, mitochondrial [Salarias fasciatus]|uniref:Coenzyme Q-binding protein COQ10 homolog, mitochondrial-like n=1 Tax=Salarias fasciatus TaxID=181472 RepID=A0A672HM41_SALFA|nr:coenzyme Q-binding protein COQ10 homolog, mitochondrial-like [Salarias fasciatus]